MTTARNTCPMLLLPKPGNLLRLHVPVDLHEHNKSTRKLSSPMLVQSDAVIARSTDASTHNNSCVQDPQGKLTCIRYQGLWVETVYDNHGRSKRNRRRRLLRVLNVSGQVSVTMWKGAKLLCKLKPKENDAHKKRQRDIWPQPRCSSGCHTQIESNCYG